VFRAALIGRRNSLLGKTAAHLGDETVVGGVTSYQSIHQLAVLSDNKMRRVIDLSAPAGTTHGDSRLIYDKQVTETSCHIGLHRCATRP